MGSTIDDRNASLTLRELQHGAKFAEFFGITSHSKFCKWQSCFPLPGKVCSYCFGAGSGLIGSQFFIIPSIFSRLVRHSLLKFCGLSFSIYFRRVKFFIPNVRTLNTPCWFSFVSGYSVIIPLHYFDYYSGRVRLTLFWNKNNWNNLQTFLYGINLGRYIYNSLPRNDAGILLCILTASKF